MFKIVVLALIGFGVFLGVRFADDIKEYISEDEIEALGDHMLDGAINTLEEIKG